MKNQTLFPHKTFLHQNAIDVEKLPDALKKRIYGFEELEQDLPTTVDEDRERLLSRMEDLSHELDEDLEEHFEEHIANNHEHDDETEIEHHESGPIQLEHECECQHAKKVENEVLPEPAPPDAPAPIAPESTMKTDEDILAELLAAGWNKILPADLRKKGFKAELGFKVIAVGRFYLRKGKYDMHYQILRGWD